jgi:hypothetical protein
MSKSRLFSGKIKKLNGGNLTVDRYEYLDTSQAEPDLGLPSLSGSVLIGSTSTSIRTWSTILTANTNSVNILSTLSNFGFNSPNALMVSGGVSIGGFLNVAGKAYLNNAEVLTTQSGLTSILGISVINQTLFINTTTNSTSTNSGALIVSGGVGVGRDLYVGGSLTVNGALVLTTSSIGNSAVTSITAGTDTAVSTSTGPVIIWNTSTLQTVTGRGATTTNAINIINGTNSTSTTTGALQVAGGVGIGGDLYVGGNIVAQKLTIQLTTITTTNVVTDDIISTYNTTDSVSTDSGALVVAGGAGIGKTLYVGGDIYSQGQKVVTTATINQFANQTNITAGTDIAVSTSTGNITISNTSTLQTVTGRGATTTNAISITNTTSSTSTITGALVVAGGVGIGGDLNVGGNLSVAGSFIITTSSITSYIIPTIITAGTDIAVNTSTGNITISNTSTLQTVTGRGATTTNAISITNTTSSTSTTTGALVVTGGVGIGGSVNIAGGLIAGGINLLNKNQHIWYVDSVIGVNDYTKNGHPLSPARTIKYALSYADSGDTVFIQPGTYYEEFPLTVAEGVNVRGAGLREVVVNPTTATNTATAFLFMGETLISDFTVGGFFEPGYAFEFAPNAVTTTKSPYIERFSVITKGSVTSAGDPYGFDSNNAGGGAKIDGSRVLATSTQASMMFNETTFIVPNATGLYMTNGARAEVINTFFYFADKAIHAVTSSTGYAGAGKTKLKLGGVSGTLTVGDTLFYKTSGGTTLASGTIASVDGSYVYITGAAWGFDTVSTRTAKVISVLGNTNVDTVVKKYGTGSAKFDGTGDALTIPTSADFAFGTGTFTIECWVRLNTLTGTQILFDFRNDGTTSSSYAPIITLISGTLNYQTVAGNRIVGTTLTTNTWYHVAVARSGTATKLFLDGTQVGSTYTDTNNYIQGPLTIGAQYNGSFSVNGYIDDIRVTKGLARYTTSPGSNLPASALVVDEYTVLMLHADGVSGSTVFSDENTVPQVIYSTGTTYATATSIELADYHQFGAEIRSLGSAAIFGNSGVTADGTGTDIKLIAFNVSHIGAGKDSSDDISLVVQANEIIQINGGRVYYQTVDQGGDFRVGESFLVNQRTGDVSFGNAQVNLANLGQITVTDGVNNAVILPTSVSVGNLSLSGGSLVTQSGNLTLDPSGTLTTINSDAQINGTASVSGITNISNQSASISTTTGALIVAGGVGIGGDLYVGGALYQQGQQVLTTASVNQFANQTTITAGTDTAVSTSTGNITISNTSTLQTVTGRGATTTNAISITNTTSSTSTTTGALIVTGGVGIGGDLYLNGILYQNGQQVLSTATINQFSNQTSITAGTDIAVSTSTGNITISNTSTLQTVTGRGSTTTNAIRISNTSSSTSITTGALVVAGGVGVGGALYVNNSVKVGYDTVVGQSNSTTNGALQVVGGVGITGNLNIGGTFNASSVQINGQSVGFGHTGSVGYTGSTGTQGFSGSAGFTGSASTATGFTGSQGPNGNDGTSVTIIGSTSTATTLAFSTLDPYPVRGDGIIVTFDGHLWTYTSSTGVGSVFGFVDVGVIVGYTGSVGPPGAGLTGSTGTQGIQGFTGSASTATGFTGSQGYTGSLGNFSSAIQVISTQSGTSYTLQLADAGTLISFTNASQTVVTIPDDSTTNFAVGQRIDLEQYGTGPVVISAGLGVLIRTTDSPILNNQYTIGTLIKIGPYEWTFAGPATTQAGFVGSAGVGFVGSQGYTGSRGDFSSAIQVINTQTTSSYTLVLSDAGGLVNLTNAISTVVTIPPENSVSFSIGQRIDLTQGNIGPVVVSGGAGVTLHYTDSPVLTNPYSVATLIKIGSNEWSYFGPATYSVGYTGSQGIIGFTGSTGTQGIIGFTGSTGTQGIIGFTGSTGTQGIIGFTGSTGTQGIIGFTGSTGTQGIIGFTGSTGTQGIIGFTGSTGTQGIIGFTGSAGQKGDTGSASTASGVFEGGLITGITTITNTTISTSTTTGALVVYGGVGIGKNLYVSGNIYQNGAPIGGSTPGNITMYQSGYVTAFVGVQRWYAPYNLNITSIKTKLGTAASSANIITINRNSTPITNITISGAATSGTTYTTPLSMNEDDYLTVNVSPITPQLTTATNLYVQFKYVAS